MIDVPDRDFCDLLETLRVFTDMVITMIMPEFFDILITN